MNLDQRLADVRKQFADSLNKQLWEEVVPRGAALGFGGAAAGRGLLGIYNMLNRNTRKPTRPLNAPQFVSVPTFDEEQEKVSNFSLNPSDWWEGAKGYGKGEWASNVKGHPLFLPVASTATVGGGLAGWKLMDWVLDKRRKQELEGELGQAKSDYEQALLSQHDKQASELGQDLDRLFDLCQEKQGLTAGDAAGMLGGLGLLSLGGLGIGSGIVSYNLTKKKNQAEVLRKALEQQRRKRYGMNPPRIYAMPTPVDSNNPLKTAPDEDALDGDPLDKVAVSN